VLVGDDGAARPAEVPKALERDEDERAAVRVAAFAEHRHAGCKVQRLGPLGDAVVRRADGVQRETVSRLCLESSIADLPTSVRKAVCPLRGGV
jgi:hypothetical protein